MCLFSVVFIFMHSFQAERQGFEPWDPLTRVNGFRDRPIRPLWHLSGFGVAKIGTIWLRTKKLRFNGFSTGSNLPLALPVASG